MSVTTPGLAQVLHPVLKQPPILTSGELTAEVLADWDNSCGQYFLHSKGIAVADRVAFVAAGFQDRLVQGWWKSNATTLKTLSWDDFLAELRSQFLDDNWDHAIRSELLNMRMKTGVSFLDFSRKFELKNAVLSGSPLHYDAASLRNELTARLTPRLQAHAYTSTVLAISDYVRWKKEMLREDKDWGKKRAAEAEEIALLTARLTKSSLQPRHYPTNNASSSSAAPAGAGKTAFSTT